MSTSSRILPFTIRYQVILGFGRPSALQPMVALLIRWKLVSMMSGETLAPTNGVNLRGGPLLTDTDISPGRVLPVKKLSTIEGSSKVNISKIMFRVTIQIPLPLSLALRRVVLSAVPTALLAKHLYSLSPETLNRRRMAILVAFITKTALSDSSN